ncbi:MAG TPA: riboflavin synthase [Nitriliruptorales bacterium]
MFTGIVEEIGRVRSLERAGDRARLAIEGPGVVTDVTTGDSIAVSGCCLTVTTLLAEGRDRVGFTADLMAETLHATALGDLAAGDAVNLERAMMATDRFGGHLVQGHVDGVGTIVAIDEHPGTLFVTIGAPDLVAPYLVAKGSVTLAGVSLTVIDVQRAPEGATTFSVGLIPHTREVTTLGSLAVGDRVNLEADVIAKYVLRLLEGGAASPYARPPGPES